MGQKLGNLSELRDIAACLLIAANSIMCIDQVLVKEVITKSLVAWKGIYTEGDLILINKIYHSK